MLERDLTLQNGTISKLLPRGVSWLRLGDEGKVSRNKLGCDGFIFHGSECWITEVKIGNGKLTDNEFKLRTWCSVNKTNYIVIRFFPDYPIWIIENGQEDYTDKDLAVCIEELIS
jgi:hypothetical protein